MIGGWLLLAHMRVASKHLGDLGLILKIFISYTFRIILVHLYTIGDEQELGEPYPTLLHN